MRTRLLAALFLALIGLGGTAYRTDAARVIVCPSGCAFSSIQAAIDAAPVGAAIKIKPGTYAEQVTISKDLTLSGSGADTTVIDGGGANVVTATSGTMAQH
jgi:pectin methylesterase-like acyl-CoA thioesterase